MHEPRTRLQIAAPTCSATCSRLPPRPDTAIMSASGSAPSTGSTRPAGERTGTFLCTVHIPCLLACAGMACACRAAQAKSMSRCNSEADKP